MTRAFVFPGQGSQAIGMGKELLAAFPVARETLEEIDDALGQNLTRLMAEGPAEELTLTENAQPALMAVSMAVLRVLEAEGGVDIADACAFVAGHSLGEYSALAAARSFGLADTARLLKTRGQAMQKAVPVGEGGMAALLGAELDQAQEIADAAAEGQICSPANDNAPGQVVLSGSMGAIDRAIKIAGERGIRRSVKLPVSAPFHCAMMAPAAEVMEKALRNVEFVRPLVPVIANVTAAAVENPDDIRALLVEQVTSMVRWRESVLAMRDTGVDTLIELGAGKVLSGLTKRIDRDMTSLNAESPDDIEAVLKTF
ncbi:MAG: [acyl-carrier-protein] S-malonyltransferase [Rhodospirillaceae bacterium TMED63]|nr:[acyl-carrier-protein] S-malonyltransferase [Rhodospirillaceae bacterium]RPG04053.1 MAG: [acyl-carrier-protein] S-malonyltransferase [Rhodospirillaceae bacterium TMED63]